MLKNAYSLDKTVKYHLSVGGSAPEPLFAFGGWGLRQEKLQRDLIGSGFEPHNFRTRGKCFTICAICIAS